MELAEWEISTRTTSYEAFELLLMMIKSRVQGKIKTLQAIEVIDCVQGQAFQLLRAFLCPLKVLRQCPVEVAASSISISITYYDSVLTHSISEPHLLLVEW